MRSRITDTTRRSDICEPDALGRRSKLGSLTVYRTSLARPRLSQIPRISRIVWAGTDRLWTVDAIRDRQQLQDDSSWR
jgi:hypothetical protein